MLKTSARPQRSKRWRSGGLRIFASAQRWTDALVKSVCCPRRQQVRPSHISETDIDHAVVAFRDILTSVVFFSPHDLRVHRL
jgi:hypothetical protein